jgi:hypothetical protein
MNIPRFSAEASLYRTNERHRTLGSFRQTGDIVEAAFGLYGYNICYRKCLSTCDFNDPYCSWNCRCFCIGGPPRCYYR